MAAIKHQIQFATGFIVLSTVTVFGQNQGAIQGPASTTPLTGRTQVSIPPSVSEAERVQMNQALWVKSINLDPTGNASGFELQNITSKMIDVELQNTTSKTMTAFECSLLFTFDDGSQVTRAWTQDGLRQLAVFRLPDSSPSHYGDLTPGATITVHPFVQRFAGSARPVSVSGTILMIIYEDRTAIGDGKAIRGVFEKRKQRSAEIAAALSDLQMILTDGEMRAAASNPDQREPNGTRRKALTQRLGARIAELKQSQENSGEVGELQPVLDALSRGRPHYKWEEPDARSPEGCPSSSFRRICSEGGTMKYLPIPLKAVTEQIDSEMVEQSGELFLLPFSCSLPHTAQSLGHSFPALCRARVGRNDVLLGPHPSLPNLRQRLLPFVRLVHGYFGAVRLLRRVHARLVALRLRGPVSILLGPRRPGDLPVLVHVVSQRA